MATPDESLQDLLARSKAARDTSRQTLDEASGQHKTLSESIDRSAATHERAEARKATRLGDVAQPVLGATAHDR